ncbi:MAG: CoA ester lyase [Acidobacteriota bacterium]|nr:CoA ester lyase [Acidobacteriota bacterium]
MSVCGSSRLRRAVHFVPGGNERMLAKSLGLEADTLILDLEDAVTPDRKVEVRREVAGWLEATDFGGKERAVRINDLMTPWGREDVEVRDERGEYLDVFRYCRSMTLLAARAGGAQPIDSVFTEIGDLDGLRLDCQRAAWMGFEGKMTIHPNQIPIVNEVFTPSEAEIASAAALVAAFAENQARGRMAFRHEGQMVDAPHLHRAERVLDRARQAGAIE